MAMTKGQGKGASFSGKAPKATGSVKGSAQTVYGLKPKATKGTNGGTKPVQHAKWGK